MASKSWSKKDAAVPVGTDNTPDRSKCPPDEKVRALANGDIADDKQLEQHLLLSNQRYHRNQSKLSDVSRNCVFG
jgi:hypothetical protein